MNYKFKVGDKVKIIKIKRHELHSKPLPDNFLNRITTITKIDKNDSKLPVQTNIPIYCDKPCIYWWVHYDDIIKVNTFKQKLKFVKELI